MTALPAHLVLRDYGENEWPRVHALIARAFLGDPLDADLRAAEQVIMEWDRSWAVFDTGGADTDPAVGSIAVFSHRMALPGGVRPVAGVSQVAVAGTHRRQGILRAMMTTVLTDLRSSGEAVAALWASESAIYGRFGFGLAARHVHATLPRGSALTPGTPGPVGRLETVELPAGVDRLTAVHAHGLEQRVGDYARDQAWWKHRLFDVPSSRDGAAPVHAVVHSTDGVDDGYAILSLTEKWGSSGPAGQVGVREVVAATPAAELSLWRYLLDVDLSATTVVRCLGLDAPVLTSLVDPRTATLELGDNLYVRVVDVPRALAERSWCTDVDLVLEVRDDLLAANAGCWRVRPGDVQRVEQPADLSLDVRELGAVHLGGTSWGALARAGLVDERTPGAVAAASAAWALQADLAAPVCPMVF